MIIVVDTSLHSLTSTGKSAKITLSSHMKTEKSKISRIMGSVEVKKGRKRDTTEWVCKGPYNDKSS